MGYIIDVYSSWVDSRALSCNGNQMAGQMQAW